jgi:hypothetical protein
MVRLATYEERRIKQADVDEARYFLDKRGENTVLHKSVNNQIVGSYVLDMKKTALVKIDGPFEIQAVFYTYPYCRQTSRELSNNIDDKLEELAERGANISFNACEPDCKSGCDVPTAFVDVNFYHMEFAPGYVPKGMTEDEVPEKFR